MAELVIQVRPGATLGALDVRVALASDEDALPHEHEREHRRLVEALLPGIDPEAAGGRVAVRRERPAVEPVVG